MMVCLFFGENSFEIDQRVKALIAEYDGEVERIDGEELSSEQLPDLLSGVTLFSTKRLVVIKNASKNKTTWTTLGEWFEKGVDNEVVLTETNPDKRTKTYKWLMKHGKVVEAQELKPFEVSRWLAEQAVLREMAFEEGSAQYLAEYVGVDQWRLSNELEKLQLTGKPVTKRLITALVEPTPQATSFELLDRAFRGDQKRLQILFDTVSENEDPYMFFGLMAGQVYALTLVKFGNGLRPEEIAKETGVHPFVLRKVGGLAANITNQELRDLSARLSELDTNMKSRSVDPWTQIHSFLLALAS